MKIIVLALTIIMMTIQLRLTQNSDTPHGPLTYGTAPSFKAFSTVGIINFPEIILENGKYCLVILLISRRFAH